MPTGRRVAAGGDKLLPLLLLLLLTMLTGRTVKEWLSTMAIQLGDNDRQIMT